MRLLRRLSVILSLCLLVVALTVPASAADGNVTYTGKAESFVFSPGSDHSPTDLFPEFKDVMPGDTLTQRIVFQNKASNKVKCKVYIRALGAQPESRDFLSQLRLQVRKVTDTVMFDAPADQTAQLSDWVLLGTLYSGGEVELDVTLEVPVTLDDTYKNSAGFLDWEFAVEEMPVDPTDPEPPKTGDGARLTLWLSLMAASGLLLILLPLWYRKKTSPSE